MQECVGDVVDIMFWGRFENRKGTRTFKSFDDVIFGRL